MYIKTPLKESEFFANASEEYSTLDMIDMMHNLEKQKKYKHTIRLINGNTFRFLLESYQFLGINLLPDDVYTFVLDNKDNIDFISILADFPERSLR